MVRNNIKIGFIGVGYMGYGMALNILKRKYNLNIIAHTNRKSINKLVKLGATELKTYKNFAINSNVIIICVTNTIIAKKVINSLKSFLIKGTLIIDITTHNQNGSIEIFNMLKSRSVYYCESPVMGGPKQAELGILGAIVGCEKNIFNQSKKILKIFCKEVFYFGKVGVGAKTKLISNFLSLGTTTLVIETIKAAEKLNIDLKKLYGVAKLGSGNSGALTRIADKALKGDYKGYIFSVNNAYKDLSYISDLLINLPNAHKLSSYFKSYYKKAINKGNGNLLISELIKK